MDASDVLLGILVAFVIVPILIGYGMIVIIFSVYLTAAINAWVFGFHPEWSLFDLIQLPYQDVWLLALNNTILLFIISVVMFFSATGILKSKRDR